MNTYLETHPAVRSAVRVAAYSFLGVFVPSLFGWLSAVGDWANDGAAFPALSILAKAAVAALSAAVAAGIAFVYNKIPVGVQATYADMPAAAVVDAPEFP